jgi:hypothetical protein
VGEILPPPTSTLWVRMYISATSWTAIWRSLIKLKLELPHDPAIPPLGMYQKECPPGYDRATCTPMFIAALIHNNQILEAAQMFHG